MEKKTRYTLGREERLKSRKAIDQLFKKGDSFSIFPFRVLYILTAGQPSSVQSLLPGAGLDLRAGFTVSSRNFKKAVDRNRVKRLMRETYRLQKNDLQLAAAQNQKSLLVFFIFVGKEVPAYDWLHEKTAAVLKRLIKLTGGNS